MIQYSMLASSFSGSAVSFSSIKRVCASACTAMPASTRFILLRPGAAAAKPSERNTAASPPAKAHTVVLSVPEETNKMANAAPTLAPDDTPMISGLASGLRKTVWYTKPATPRPNPPASAITARGRRSTVKVRTAIASPASSACRVMG